MAAIGRHPAAIRALNEVFIPSAEIATTRHQREISLAADTAGLGRTPRLFSPTRAAKPNRKVGIGTRARVWPAPVPIRERAMTKAIDARKIGRSFS